MTKVLVSQCKRLSCDRHWLCAGQLEDVLRYTLAFPGQFVGVAGYSPMDIAASLREAGFAIGDYGFCGVYCHPGSFGVGLNDRRMYPLYAKSVEWRTPVVIDLQRLRGETAFVSSAAVAQAAMDFPELIMLLAHAAWPPEVLRSVAENCENVWFVFRVQALMNARVREFVASRLGQDRSLWGSDGVPWRDALARIARLGLGPEVERKVLCGNAGRVFVLDRIAAGSAVFQPANSGMVLTAE